MSVLYAPAARPDGTPPLACAAHKGAALLKDSRECELAENPAPHWRLRAIDTVRYRLRAEEAVA